MKTLGRILLILTAALAVIGATYAFSQTTILSTVIGQSMGGGEAEGRSEPPSSANAATDQSFAMAGRPEGGAEGRDGSRETVGRNLLQMAAIVAALQVLWSIGRWLKRTAASLTRRERLNPSRS